MANETASFTLRFRDEVSGPAGKASASLHNVRASLTGVESAAAGAESGVGGMARAHETAAQRIARESRAANSAMMAGRVSAHRTGLQQMLRHEQQTTKAVAGLNEDSIRRVATFGQKMDDALDHERWVRQKRSDAIKKKSAAMQRREAMKVSRSMTGGLDFSLASAGAGAGMAIGAVAALAVAAGAAAVAVGLIGAKFLEAGVRGLEFGQRAELALGNLLHHGENARKEFDDVRAMAQRLGLGVEETVGSFQKLLAAQFEVGKAKELIAMGADLQGIGASAEEVGRALLAITQIKSKGRLMAQEMLQLQEAGISAELVYTALGKKLGKTRDELAKLQEAGKIDAGTGLEAILEAVRVKTGTSKAGELGEKFAGTTLAGMQASLGSGITNLFIDIGRKLEPIVMPIAQRVAGLFGAITNDPVIRGIGASLLDSLKVFGDWVVANWPQIQGVIVGGVQALGRVFQGVMAVGRFMIDNWETIKMVGVGVGVVLGTLAVGAALLLLPLYLAVGAIAAVVGAVAYALGYVYDNIGKWATAGYDMIMGLVDGVKSAATALYNAAIGVVSSAVDAVTSFLQIGSPSKLFAGFGEMTVQGYTAGVQVATPAAGDAAAQMVGTAAQSAVTATGEVARGVGVPFVGPTGRAANDGAAMAPPTIAPASFSEQSVSYEASAAGSGRGITVQVINHIQLSGTATEEDGQRLLTSLEPGIRRVVLKVFDEMSLTGS